MLSDKNVQTKQMQTKLQLSELQQHHKSCMESAPLSW